MPGLRPELSTRSFRRGDPEALQKVRSRVRRLLGCQVPALPAEHREDLEQEIMMQLWQGLGRESFEHDREVWGYVAVVTSRRVIDWRRRRFRRPEHGASELDGLASGDGGHRRRQAQMLTRQLLATLSELCRQMLKLRFHRELSYGEMADLLGHSEGALRVRLHRCIAQARDSLRQDRPGKDRTGKDRTGKDRPGKNQTEKDRPGKDRTGKNRLRQQTGSTEGAP